MFSHLTFVIAVLYGSRIQKGFKNRLFDEIYMFSPFYTMTWYGEKLIIISYRHGIFPSPQGNHLAWLNSITVGQHIDIDGVMNKHTCTFIIHIYILLIYMYIAYIYIYIHTHTYIYRHHLGRLASSAPATTLPPWRPLWMWGQRTPPRRSSRLRPFTASRLGPTTCVPWTSQWLAYRVLEVRLWP